MIYAECLLQGDSEEILKQRKEMEKAAQYHGWSILKVYTEKAAQAAMKMVDRTAIQDLLADAVQNRFDVLMFAQTEHLGEDDDKVAAFLLQMDRNGVSLYHLENNQLSLAAGTALQSFLEASRR